MKSKRQCEQHSCISRGKQQGDFKYKTHSTNITALKTYNRLGFTLGLNAMCTVKAHFCLMHSV